MEIEVTQINTDTYHPEAKFSAIYHFTPTKFRIDYGHTKEEAIQNLREQVDRENRRNEDKLVIKEK